MQKKISKSNYKNFAILHHESRKFFGEYPSQLRGKAVRAIFSLSNMTKVKMRNLTEVNENHQVTNTEY